MHPYKGAGPGRGAHKANSGHGKHARGQSCHPQFHMAAQIFSTCLSEALWQPYVDMWPHINSTTNIPEVIGCCTHQRGLTRGTRQCPTGCRPACEHERASTQRQLTHPCKVRAAQVLTATFGWGRGQRCSYSIAFRHFGAFLPIPLSNVALPPAGCQIARGHPCTATMLPPPKLVPIYFCQRVSLQISFFINAGNAFAGVFPLASLAGVYQGVAGTYQGAMYTLYHKPLHAIITLYKVCLFAAVMGSGEPFRS